MSKYLNYDGTLIDKKVIEDIRKAESMYRNGELLETHDVLSEIVEAIRTFLW